LLQPDLSHAAIAEGRAASKSPHLKFGYFLSMSQQAVSADIIPNLTVGIFSPKTEGILGSLSNFKIQQ
jgi:hypothetical protein